MWKGQPAYLELLDEAPGTSRSARRGSPIRQPPADAVERRVARCPEDAPKPRRIRELEAKIPTPRRAPTMRDGTGINERVFVRGSHKTLGVEAPAAFLEAFGKPAFTRAGSGRLELAKALTDPANPLVARVIVNRLWKHHFGEGSSAGRTTSATRASRRRTRNCSTGWRASS